MVNEEWKSRLEGGGPSYLPSALNVMFSGCVVQCMFTCGTRRLRLQCTCVGLPSLLFKR